jgi:hypothetical protein
MKVMQKGDGSTLLELMAVTVEKIDFAGSNFVNSFAMNYFSM